MRSMRKAEWLLLRGSAWTVAAAGLLSLTLAAAAFGQDTPPAAAPSDNGGAAPSAPEASGGTATVQDLGFSYASPKSKLTITFDKEISFEKTVSEADKQVIIDIPNANIGKKFARRIQTTEFKSNVVMISPYLAGNRVRVTLQLRENGGVEVSQDGKTITVSIDNKQEVAEKPAEQAKELTDAEKAAAVPDASKGAAIEGGAGGAAAAPGGPGQPGGAAAGASESMATSPAASASGDNLDQFMKSQDSHQYVGKHIWLQVQDADLADVFRIISEASEFNIVLSELVRGKAVLNLTDIPWDEALDIILKSYHLSAEREGNVLRVTTMEAMQAERDAEAAARKAQEAAEPLVVKIFPISFASANDLAAIIRDFMTKEAPTLQQPGVNPAQQQLQLPPGASGAFNLIQLTSYRGPIRGSIQIDARTNSLIIRDTAAVMEKIKKIIKELDTPTPQILIEGKFVEVQDTWSNSLTGQFFLNNAEFDPVAQSFSFPGGNNNFASQINTTLGAGGSVQPPAISGGNGIGLGFIPKANILPGIGEIGALLNYSETEGTSRIIASPRVVTQNKEAATITSGQNLFLNTATVSTGSVGTATTTTSSSSVSEITETMTLTVTPQVTNEGSILLRLSFSQDSPAATVAGTQLTTNTKTISTVVLVDSGGTIVIGGVYQKSDTDSEGGIPFLHNLPIIGALFGSSAKATSKDELFIFLSPRILNEKESGLKSG